MENGMKVRVTVCERGAIYVNDTRITTGATKWGVRKTLADFECQMGDVVSSIIEMGFRGHVRNIDTEPYLSQAESREALAKVAEGK